MSVVTFYLRLLCSLLMAANCFLATTLVVGRFSPEMRERLSSHEAINPNPTFEWPIDWSPGLSLAFGRGQGVVVGPGGENPNVFAQYVPVIPGETLRFTARATSVDGATATAQIQINWMDAHDGFITTSIAKFQVAPTTRAFEQQLVVPPGTKTAILYVVPGNQSEAVRYTEMSVARPNWARDFIDLWFFSTTVQWILFAASAALLLIIGCYLAFRNRDVRCRSGDVNKSRSS